MAREVLSQKDFVPVVIRHAETYPQWEMDDLYKLVFQAAMGSEHAVNNPELALERLQAEAEAVGPSNGSPMIMPLSPDCRLVRIDLRAYLSKGGDLGDLAKAFVETSQKFKPSLVRLVEYWSCAESMAKQKEISFSLPDLRAYSEHQCRQGYPPVHHSEAYRRLYSPAYRVVLKSLMGTLVE